MKEVKHGLPFLFEEAMTTDTFNKKFSGLALEKRYFLERLIEVVNPAPKSNQEIMKQEANTPCKPLKTSMFVKSPDQILKDVGTEQVRQIVQALFP